MSHLPSLRGKTAFVTGAASGIGLGISTALAEQGARLMMCDIDAKALDAEAGRLRAGGAEVETMVVDVSVKEEIQKAADATIARFGKVHVLVNNAGIMDSAQYGSWTDQGWDWTLGVNLRAVIWGIEIFGPLLESHGEGGQIVSTASVGGITTSPQVAYNVSKHGVVALSEGLRPVLAERGIGVSVLCPGSVRTQILNSTRVLPERFRNGVKDWNKEGAAGEAYDKMVSGIGRGLDPLYVGRVVCEAIENDWGYIITDTGWEAKIKARFAMIEEAIDRIRDRQPADFNVPEA